MTHGHEPKGGNVGGRWCAGRRGIKRGKWDNCNSRVNKLFFLKKRSSKWGLRFGANEGALLWSWGVESLGCQLLPVPLGGYSRCWGPGHLLCLMGAEGQGRCRPGGSPWTSRITTEAAALLAFSGQFLSDPGYLPAHPVCTSQPPAPKPTGTCTLPWQTDTAWSLQPQRQAPAGPGRPVLGRSLPHRSQRLPGA